MAKSGGATTTTGAPKSGGGILGWIERAGNKLPDPVFLFIYLIFILVIISVVADLLKVSVPHPIQKNEDGTPVVIGAASLLAPENIGKLLVEAPKTFTNFPPLGFVLVVMLGAAVAERSGLFAAAMRGLVRSAPKFLLTPTVAFAGMLGHVAADAAYVVLIPLAGVLFAAAGRHPLAGIAAAFAAVSGGFSANLVPAQLDALLFGITQPAAQIVDPGWTANIAGNWYFIAGMLVVFIPLIWFVTDLVIEPRLKKFTPVAPQTESGRQAMQGDQQLSAAEKKGLGAAGLASLVVVGFWLFFTFGPGTPLIDEKAEGPARMTPFFQSLIAAFFLYFLATGWAYGRAAGTVKTHHDIVRMMKESMGDLAYYLVLTFFCAHFVAMFAWSNLGLILAVNGADAIKASGLSTPWLLALTVLVTAFINLFVGSASAKWALLAPVLVPMFMLLGISPEATTGAYRVGDGATNIITPLMVYFPLILTFCQRWNKEFGLGSLIATMLPYSIWLLIVGFALTFGWISLDLPLGPHAPAHYTPPAQ
jgi:aminobenzoyl-glutamate transport protein